MAVLSGATYGALVGLIKETLAGAGALRGDKGDPGREIELQTNITHIQWRYIGGLWRDLILLDNLKVKGDKGDQGDTGETPQFQMSGNTLQYRFATQSPTTWTDIYTFTEGDGSSIITSPITVSNEIGGWKNNDIIPAGTALEAILKKMLNPVIPPTYLAPTLTLAGTTPLAREIGENINITLTPAFTQRDGGAITQYRLSKNGSNLFTGATAIPQNDSLQLTANTTYQASADYSQGPIKNDSANNPDPNGRIPAGTVTSGNVIYLPQRRSFFGRLISDTVPNTNALVRALTQNALNSQNNSVMVASVQAGDRGVCFAYPATLRAPTSITQAGFMNMDVKDAFTEITVTVEGANGYSPIAYRVLYNINDLPFSANDTFTLTV